MIATIEIRHRYFGVVARGRDLHFFERAVVEIDRRVLIGPIVIFMPSTCSFGCDSTP